MHPTNCLNCFRPILEEQKFCSGCGQKTDSHRLNMRHILHDLQHAFLHADKGILYLIKEMAYRPGYVALEFVQGQRKKYFNPFSFLVIVVAISTVFMSGFDLMSVQGRPNVISKFMSKYFNLVIFFTVPLIAFFTWIFFRKTGKNYSEFLVLAAFTSGERSVFMNIFILPLWIFFKQWYTPVLYTYMLLYFTYFGWACMQFSGKKTAWSFIKGFLIPLIVQIIITIMVIAAIKIYYTFYHHPK